MFFLSEIATKLVAWREERALEGENRKSSKWGGGEIRLDNRNIS